MPLWKLEPLDLGDRNWEASTYKGEVIVRADDLRRAQRLAARAFGIATQHRPGETVKIIPWDYSGLVAASQVQATDEYAEDGDQGIVYPPEAVRSAHPQYEQD